MEWDLDAIKPLGLEVGISPLSKSIFIIFRQWRKEFNHLFINSNSRRKKACLWISISCFCFVKNCSLFLACGLVIRKAFYTDYWVLVMHVCYSFTFRILGIQWNMFDWFNSLMHLFITKNIGTWLVILIPALTLSSIRGDMDVRIFQFCNFLNSNDLHFHWTSVMHFYDNSKNLKRSHL